MIVELFELFRTKLEAQALGPNQEYEERCLSVFASLDRGQIMCGQTGLNLCLKSGEQRCDQGLKKSLCIQETPIYVAYCLIMVQ